MERPEAMIGRKDQVDPTGASEGPRGVGGRATSCTATTSGGCGRALLAGTQRTRRVLAASLAWRPAIVIRFVGSARARTQHLQADFVWPLDQTVLALRGSCGCSSPRDSRSKKGRR